MKYHIFLGLLTVVSAYPSIHEEAQLEEQYEHSPIAESGHHHAIEHEHAKSHQSIKFEHFHPVPVYIKKEHKHLMEHPLEKGQSGQKLKLIHPETQHHHGYGLVLEDDRHNTEHLTAPLHHAGFEHASIEQGDFEQEHGGLEGFGGGESEGSQFADAGHYSQASHHFPEHNFQHDSY